MQRKISNTKKVRSGTHVQSGQKKLHSIPIINKVKSNVLYSIPCVKSYTHSFCRTKLFSSTKLDVCNAIFLFSICTLTSTLANTLLNANHTYAATETFGDSTASMTLDTSDVVVNVVPGETGYASKSITVSTNNTESYALIITAPAVLKNESSNSTNPWSYAYGQSGELSTMSYTNFDGNTKELESGIESSGSTKTLAFSSTFAEGLASGHYKAEVTLGLVSTPKTVLGVWTLADGNTQASGITTMQEMTPSICKQVDTPVAVATPGGTNAPTMKLKDTRDDSIYSIAKYPDGRCWMTQNLKLMGDNLKEPVSAGNSDGTPADGWSMPRSDKYGFSNNTESYAFLPTANDVPENADAHVITNTGYYSWCTATAGTCVSSPNIGDNAPSSICPKGWKLPRGRTIGDNISNDFYNLFKNMGLDISNSLADYNATAWQSGDLAKAQSLPYNFTYVGRVTYGDMNNIDEGYWWTRTMSNAGDAFHLLIVNNSVYPGTGSNFLREGCAVRCIAEASEPKTFTLTYDQNSTGNVTNMPSSQSCTTISDSCTITLPNEKPQWSGYYLVGWDTTKKTTSCIVTAQYGAGSQITLTGDTTLYATWGISGCGSA